MDIVDRLRAGVLGTAGGMGVFDPQAREQWPDLWQLMSLTELAGGLIRVPSTLKVQLGRLEWIVSVNDEDTRQTLLVASQSLTEVFARVESQLHSADAVWRQWPPKNNPRGRR